MPTHIRALYGHKLIAPTAVWWHLWRTDAKLTTPWRQRCEGINTPTHRQSGSFCGYLSELGDQSTEFLGKSLSVPLRPSYAVTAAYRKLPSITNCCSFTHMKYTFACGMISVTKRCVTFKHNCNKFNFHNGMKTTKTLSHDRVVWLSVRSAARTHQDKHL
jgi:hypothetical protein